MQALKEGSIGIGNNINRIVESQLEDVRMVDFDKLPPANDLQRIVCSLAQSANVGNFALMRLDTHLNFSHFLLEC